MRLIRSLVVVMVAAGTLDCAQSIRASDALALFNTSSRNSRPPFEPVAREVTGITRESLADAYFNSECVGALLDGEQAPRTITEAMACVGRARSPAAEDQCYHSLFARLNLPTPPTAEQRNLETWALEQDVTRLGTNLKRLVREAVRYHRISQLAPVKPDEGEVISGVATGIADLRDYLSRRHVRRERAHFVTSLSFSGGAANGAYSAGAAWWLLLRLDACKSAAERNLVAACPDGNRACLARARQLPENACLEDHVDMVSGASAGAVTAVLIKDYFSHRADARKHALGQLLGRYTCSANSDLYCVNNTDLARLGLDPGGRSTGLVRFDGFHKLLEQEVSDDTYHSLTEDFVSTVEFQSGRVLQLSSADPHDISSSAELKQAIMASIVEPVLAEPISRVGALRGVLLDGGVRSGLPIRAPLERGATRALVFVNAPMEPRPLSEAPPHALAIGERTLDLFSHQPIVGELHEAEFELATRRALEYELCVERLKNPPPPTTVTLPPQCSYHALADTTLRPLPVDRGQPAVSLTGHGGSAPDDEIQALCSGAVWPETAGQGSQNTEEMSTDLPRSISLEYRSTLIFQPHVLPASMQGPNSVEPGVTQEDLFAPGYAFEPKTMWKLFVFGAAVMQERCREANGTLGWHIGRWCGTAQDLKTELSPARKRAELHCWNKKPDNRLCGDGDVQELR